MNKRIKNKINKRFGAYHYKDKMYHMGKSMCIGISPVFIQTLVYCENPLLSNTINHLIDEPAIKIKQIGNYFFMADDDENN